MEDNKKERASVVSSQLCLLTGQEAARKFHMNTCTPIQQKYESGQILEQSPREITESPMSGDTKNLAGHPDLSDVAWTNRVGLGDLKTTLSA